MNDIHECHRQRLRARFLREGLDSFDDHTVLELLLFYAVPRRDTNELAHMLINRFGSFDGVLDADIEELMTVGGIGHNSAMFIKLIPSVARYYINSSTDNRDVYDSAEKLGRYCISKFIGINVESVYMICLDSSYHILSCKLLSSGSVNSSVITTKMIIEGAIYNHASTVVLAHNHPGGIAVPSSEDIATTRLMQEALSLVDVELLEHFVIAGDRYMPIMFGSLGDLRQSEISAAKQKFYKDMGHIYDSEA